MKHAMMPHMSMEHLRVLIKTRGVTQTQLARVLNRDKSAVTNLLQGKRLLKAEEVIRIAEFLGISEAEVLGRPPADGGGLSMPRAPVVVSPPPVTSPPPVAAHADAPTVPFITLEGQAPRLYEYPVFTGHKLQAFEVPDESMNLAGLLPGDVVLLDMQAPMHKEQILLVQQYNGADTLTVLRRYKPPFLLPESTHDGFEKLHQERANVRLLAPVIGMIRRMD